MFRDEDLELDLPAMRRHVRFLIDGGIREGTGVLLAGGAAGDFSTLSFDERVQLSEAVIQESDGRVPVVVGAQTTSTRELVALARAAGQIGADYVQVSPPFYFAHTEGDFYEYAVAASEAAGEVGLVVYNTHWTTPNVSLAAVKRLVELPNVIGLKWAVPESGSMQFEEMIVRFADRACVIDNQLQNVTSHILGARGFEIHQCNYWPQWGVRLLKLLEEERYAEAQHELVRVVLPFYVLWREMEEYTSGDGYLDKLCLELIGLGSSRCRPPTRDVRDRFREKTRQMLLRCGVPGVVGGRAPPGE
jgi:dihydrodipicolinate synthase/N-acetylneuraminate lyase